MIIGGFQKVSLIDYPGKICAIVFTQGCNFRCPFCYNLNLVLPELFKEPILEKDILSFLDKRKGKLDAVEITGGEPTIQEGLLDFMKKIKEKGFLIKLDTNGTNPDVLKTAIKGKLVDYLAMDIKAPWDKYFQVAGVDVEIKKIQESIKIIKESGIDYEFRTTVIPGMHTKEDIIKIAQEIKPAKKYCLQNFQQKKTINPKFESLQPYSKEFLEEIVKEIKEGFEICQVR